MDLDRMTVAVRPRNAWEGIDHGFAMAREWFMPLWCLWLSAALPVYLLAALVFPERPWLVILLVWWLKPLYEPPLLFWLSRTLFGETQNIRTVLSQWFSIVKPQLLANLTWRRLSPNRSFYMPVALLEGLRGKERKHRLAVLGRKQHAGGWLTLAGVHFELALEISFLILLFVMLPEELRWIDLEQLFLTPGTPEEWLHHIGNLLAMSVIAPFYVAGGFALYLTRRSELEAWDIEISFHRLKARRERRVRTSGFGPAVGMVALLWTLPGVDGLSARAAQFERGQVKAVIEEVLAQDAFGEKESVGYWKYIGQKDADEEGGHWFWELLTEFIEGFMSGFATVGEVLLWMGGGLLLAYLLYKAWISREWLRPRRTQSSQRKAAPVSLMGMDISPENLPRDIGGEARRLLDGDDFRAALSLLYRGTLAKFVHKDQLEIPDSATEVECLRLVAAGQPAEQARFFERLTLNWVRLAYDHQLPGREVIESLCGEWRLTCAGEKNSAE